MTEQAMIYVALKPLLCSGAPIEAGDCSVTFLENYVDGILPSEVFITSTTWWFDGTTAFEPTTNGNIIAMVDPQMSYVAASGFPDHQAYEPQYLKFLNYRRLAPGEPNGVTMNLSPPVAYRSGDALIIAPEIQGPTILGSFLLVNIETTGDLLNLPQPTQLMKLQLITPSAAQPGTSVRNIIPASSVAGTKIRARVSSNEYQYKSDGTGANLSVIQHLSVGLQSGSTSSCTATPVEMKFGGKSGVTLYNRQWAWSDWTPLNVPSGQNLLVTASLFWPGTSNYWSYNGVNGFGVWSAAGDSWNTAALQGTAPFYANATSAVDMVQVQ